MRLFGDKNERLVMPTGNGATEVEAYQTEDLRQFWESRWQTEDTRWERQTLENRTAAMLDRLGSTNPGLRLLAVEQLVNQAQQRVPGGPLVINAETCPFFRTVVSGFTALLLVEEHPEVRHAVKKGLDALISFSRQGEQLLLFSLIAALAETNRMALRAFEETLGVYLAKYGAEDIALPPLVGFLGFCENAEWTRRCLYDLAESSACRRLQREAGALRLAQAKLGEASAAANNTLLEALRTGGNRLCDTRDLLAMSLREMMDPPLGADSTRLEFERWRAAHPLPLRGVFLVGTRLSGISLVGAFLPQAYLHGTNLEGVDFSGAELEGARLAGAEISGISLEDEVLPPANLRNADWWNASPQSWHGFAGEKLKTLLSQRFPEQAPVLKAADVPAASEAASATDANAIPAMPAPAPMPEVTAPGQGAANKIAELKRRSAKTAAPKAASEGRADPRKDKPIPAAVRGNNLGVLGLAPGQVQIRDKALPDENVELDENDLLDVTDLMADTYTAGTTSVKPNEIPREDGELTEEDLVAIAEQLGKQ
ncbi:MAG: hypothetical protein OHK0029_03190 [Armatimonadaceae bacterium]